jgi:hypothetical protein
MTSRGGALRLLLQFLRTQDPGDAYAFRFAAQEYVLPTPARRHGWPAP